MQSFTPHQKSLNTHVVRTGGGGAEGAVGFENGKPVARFRFRLRGKIPGDVLQFIND
jgi:hypothetical protein